MSEVIPAEAVEAAHKAWREQAALDGSIFEYNLRAALEAAAPHMREDKRGAGDYLPGWDDRKTLAGIWQEHAMLPVEGLSDGVYSALIAVATWGYQQRKDEDL